MVGMGGLTALSMSGTTAARAREVMAGDLPTDPHTLDTYRSIVDAIVPRTPELEEELGPEHVPGGLDVGLETFIVWDFDHFQDVRREALTRDLRDRLRVDLDRDGLGDLASAVVGDGGGSIGDGGLQGGDSGPLGGLDGLDLGAPSDAFGSLEAMRVAIRDGAAGDGGDEDEGTVPFDLAVETADGSTQRVVGNYPYAPLLAVAFDLVALDFLARGGNEEPPSADGEFPAGGLFTTLAPRDRLRCLWTIVDGGAVDRLDDALSTLLPTVGILKYVVMAVNGLHGFGYYTEWSGYGDTKDDAATDRELVTPAGEVQSRVQTGYPGPAPGYAADWRHAVPGDFDDPPADELDLPDDLTGEDVRYGSGGAS